MTPAHSRLALALLTCVGWLEGCKFPELPPLQEDGGIDAAFEACVDTGADSPDPRCPPERPLEPEFTC